MNKRQNNHFLALARRAILVLFDLDDYDFNIVAYNFTGPNCVYLTIEVEDSFGDVQHYKVRIENDTVTYLCQSNNEYL